MSCLICSSSPVLQKLTLFWRGIRTRDCKDPASLSPCSACCYSSAQVDLLALNFPCCWSSSLCWAEHGTAAAPVCWALQDVVVCWVLHAGVSCWVFHAGCLMLGVSCWVFVTCWVQFAGHCVPLLPPRWSLCLTLLDAFTAWIFHSVSNKLWLPSN